ncbi:hypothetical protein, partial [Streptomyces olivaceus]
PTPQPSNRLQPCPPYRDNDNHQLKTRSAAGVLREHLIHQKPTRKIFGWKTPAEVLKEQLRSLQQPGVAKTG